MSVAQELLTTAVDVKYRARIVSYSCDGDGCPVESTKPWRDGWTRREDGADLCPECSP